jgi:hypothetical protein
VSSAPVERAQELADESKFLSLCRIGFLGRGLLYILIGVLALRSGRTEDLTGALEYLGRGENRILLMIIAAGLAAYALWRLCDATFGIENPGRYGKALRKRAAAAGIGAIYLFLSYKAVRVLLAGRAGTATAQEQADKALDLPGGEWVLGAIAAGLAVGGIVQIRKAGKCSFLRTLDDRARAPFVKWLGRLGYAARGVIFLTLAYLFASAAMQSSSSEVGGMEQALDFFSGPILYAVSVGLMLFGAFSIIEALFRRIHEPPVEQIKAEVRERVGP